MGSIEHLFFLQSSKCFFPPSTFFSINPFFPSTFFSINLFFPSTFFFHQPFFSINLFFHQPFLLLSIAPFFEGEKKWPEKSPPDKNKRLSSNLEQNILLLIQKVNREKTENICHTIYSLLLVL